MYSRKPELVSLIVVIPGPFFLSFSFYSREKDLVGERSKVCCCFVLFLTCILEASVSDSVEVRRDCSICAL